MTTWRRLLGLVDDAVAGGSSYDDLTLGAIPVADTFIPFMNANVTGGGVNLDRNQEGRGYRGSPPPIPHRASPVVDLQAIAYPSLVKKFARLWTGGTDSPVGTPPASILHALEAIQSGELPGVHVGVVRDEQYDKVAGCTCNTFALDLPLLELATVSTQLRGKYRVRSDDAPPAGDYSDYPDRGFLLRDAKVFIDGSPTDIPDLAGLSFNFDNQMADPAEFRPGHNVVKTTHSGEKKRLWWPDEHRFMGHQMTGSIQFSKPKPDQDLAMELAHAEQIVFECEFEDLGTTPAAVEIMRITGSKMVRTEGGAEQLTKQDKITSSYSFGLFIDEATGDDAVFEFVDASDDPIV